MLKATARLEGIEELERKLDKLTDVISHKTLGPDLLKQAEALRDRIRDKAPLGPTGNLKRSPIAKLMPDKPNMPAIAIAGIDRKIAPHAHLVEFGTSRAPAHPFFRPAIDEMKGQIMQGIADSAKQKIEGAI